MLSYSQLNVKCFRNPSVRYLLLLYLFLSCALYACLVYPRDYPTVKSTSYELQYIETIMNNKHNWSTYCINWYSNWYTYWLTINWYFLHAGVLRDVNSHILDRNN